MTTLREAVSDKPREIPPEHAGIAAYAYPYLWEYHLGVAGKGEHAYTWQDKPHRLVYNLTSRCAFLERENADLRTALAEPEEKQKIFETVRVRIMPELKMNERIKLLAEQQGLTGPNCLISSQELDKFAELIIQEAIAAVQSWKGEPFPFSEDLAADLIREHFGVDK